MIPVPLLTTDQINRLPERAREAVEYRKSPKVRPHTFAVLEHLDERELTNHVLVITRHQLKPYDIDRLNQLRHIKVTLLFTYSGIDNPKIEPYPSHVAADSLKLMSAPSYRKYRTVLYWRPLVPGLNDTDEHLAAENMCAAALAYREMYRPASIA